MTEPVDKSSELTEIDSIYSFALICSTKPETLLILPRSNSSIELCTLLSNKYGVPVIPVNCLELTEQEVNDILSDILYEFPISNVEWSL